MGDSGSMISSNGTDAIASLINCPNCNLNLAGFPAGVRFAPSEQELIEHLESLVLVKEGGGSRAHALINHFITTIEGDNDICDTHPENLPGVTRDGHSKHFFHRTFKAFQTGTRKRRKILSEHGQRSSEDVGEAYWHKTGKTCPVNVGGTQKGCKKIFVLHNIQKGKREKTNWVMHQYYLGMSEEKDGELVLSKVFYRYPAATMIEHKDEKVEVTSEVMPNILPIVSGDAAVTTPTVTMVQLQQHQLQRQAHGHGQCEFAPTKMFEEDGVGDPASGDQRQVHGNNHHIPSQHQVQSVHMEPSQHQVQSVHMEPDTTLSLACHYRSV